MGAASGGDTGWPAAGWKEPHRPDGTHPVLSARPAEPAALALRTGSPELPRRAASARVRMHREIAPKAEELAAWDRLVAGTEGTDVTQLSAWATVRALAGYRPTYLLAYQRGELVGGALILRRRLLGVFSISYLPYGPVIAADLADRASVRAALVDELVAFAHRQRVMFIQPPEHADDVSTALLARGFRPSKAGIAPAGSYRLDLTLPLEQIRAGFSKRLKSWTNRWESKGVRVRRGDERDLPLLVRLMAGTGRRQGFCPPPLEYVRTLYRELDALDAVALFVGEVHGVPVSADVVTICAGTVRGRLGGFDAIGEAAKLSVPAAVRWETIKWAKRQGYRYLDFGGLPEPMLTDMIDRGIHCSDEWPSAQRSKLQFNGQPFRYPTPVERIHPAALRVAYDLAIAHPTGSRLVNKVKAMLRGSRGYATAHAGDKYH
jgi:lipid II:glycine glycyltransferase (peptidoglycan interpeptide bridge formation enzyme)